jgi:hypothetical protein
MPYSTEIYLVPEDCGINWNLVNSSYIGDTDCSEEAETEILALGKLLEKEKPLSTPFELDGKTKVIITGLLL